MLFTLNPAQQVILYLGQFAVVAAGFGCLTLHLPRMLPMPRPARFLTGFTLAPYAIGAIVMLLANIAPGGPPVLFYWLPSVLALVPLLVYGWRTVQRLVRYTRRRWKSAPSRLLLVVIAVTMLAVVWLGVMPALWANAWAPITGHDALLYSSKAVKFAEQRTAAIPGLRGDPEGTAREDAHGVLYPAFLGHAMLTGWSQEMEQGNDYALRFAFQVSFVLMLLAIMALGSTYRIAGVGALAVVLVLMVGRFGYVSFQSSRDAYRVVPLLLFTALLLGLTPARLRAGVHRSVFLPLALLPVAALYGHTLGGIVAVISAGVWTCCVVAQRAPWRRVVLVLCAIGVGLVLGSLRYFDLYLTDRMIQGYASVEGTVKDTILAPILQASRSEVAETGLLKRLRIPFSIDNFYLSLPGVLAAAVSLFWFWRNRRHTSFVFLLLALTMLAIFLPQTGLLDYSGYRISRSFVRNDRYTLHWYPYAAVCLAGMLLALHRQATAWLARSWRVWIVHAVLAALVLVSAFVAFGVIDREWRTRSAALGNQVLDLTAPVRMMVEHLPAGEHWLLDDDRYNYSLGNQALVMYTRATWPVVKAVDAQAARQALDDLEIGAVALLRADIPNWWGKLPFYRVLTDPQHALVLAGSSYLVFERAASPGDYGRQVARYLGDAEWEAPTNLLVAEQIPPTELAQDDGAAVFALAPTVELVLPDAAYAQQALRAALPGSADPAALYLALGHIDSVRGDPGAALTQYEHALAASGPSEAGAGGETGASLAASRTTDVRRFMAAAYLQRADQLAAAGDRAAALTAVESAISLARGERWFSDRLLASYTEWGRARFDASVLRVITEPLEAAVEAPGAAAADYLALARVHQQIGNQQLASDLYSEALARWPQDNAVLDALTTRVSVRADWELAARAYQQMIRNDPTDSKAYQRLAQLFLERGQAGSAVALYQAAAEANPKAGWAQLELGKLYQSQVVQQP